MAAGDLQLVKILYNSGIGPASVLNAFGKPHIVVNNAIGQKIRNQQRATLTYVDTSAVNPNFYGTPSASILYASTGTGIYAGNGGYSLSFKVLESHPYPDINVLVGLVSGSSPSYNALYSQNFTVTVGLNINVYANGTLNLTSSDPLAPTLFTANAFAVTDDATNVANGIIQARLVMKKYPNATELIPGPSYDTVAKLIPWIRANPGTSAHYYGSAYIGTDSSAPLDVRMRVQGVKRLRVVGPAIIPGAVYPGMQALAIAIGEKATDLIEEDYSL